MPPSVAAVIAGLFAGAVASYAMSRYQRASAHLFGQDAGDDDPATVKAADTIKRVAKDRPVTRKRRREAGDLVHYATGVTLGVCYALLVLYWPAAAIGFGVVFGIVVALVLDDLVTPAFGWGLWPWATGLATHAYSITAHLVFGLALEGVRRLGMAWLI